MAFIRLENLYYVHDQTLANLRESALQKSMKIENEFYECQNSKDLIFKLATMVYRYSEDKHKIKAILYQTYHHCLHNRYQTARDYLLMSHIPDQINSYEIGNQILYNRVVVQMGLAAFRLGLINEAHQALQELCNMQKTKELLAQGVSTKVQSVEKEERRNLLPYHLHINIEVIESTYYISAMLLEIPSIAQDGGKKVISKLFRKLFETYDKSVINTNFHIKFIKFYAILYKFI